MMHTLNGIPPRLRFAAVNRDALFQNIFTQTRPKLGLTNLPEFAALASPEHHYSNDHSPKVMTLRLSSLSLAIIRIFK